MTFLDSAGETAKSDTAGRVRVSRERRDQLLREFASSGISARRFAQLAGVNPVTFYSWVQKERARGQGGALRSNAGSVSFMEAVFDCPPTVSAGADAPLVVHLCVPGFTSMSKLTGVSRLHPFWNFRS